MDTTARIIEKRDLTDITKLFVVHAPLVARNTAPGQFVIIRVTETGERVPISITDFSRAAGTITIVVQVVGRTSSLVDALQVGDTEMLLDDSRRLADRVRAQGGRAELRVFHDVPHCFQVSPLLSEAKPAMGDIAAFVQRHLRGADSADGPAVAAKLKADSA